MNPLQTFRAAQQALSAYQTADALPQAPASDGGVSGQDFSQFLGNALGSAVQAGQAAEGQALGAIAGNGDLTHVVTAVSEAELALQTTVAVRDRVLQAYQDIIKMPI